MMTSRGDKLLLILIIFLAVITIAVIIFELYPFKVVQFNNPYKVLTPVVKAGGTLEYVRNSEKFIDVPTSTLSCYFEDDLIYRLPDKTAAVSLGKHTEKTAVEVPATLPPGTYFYTCDAIYKLLGLRTLTYKLYTEPFAVEK